MSLREYKRKRQINKTPEPSGVPASTVGKSFVIQKHQASHLHYDFRLELDGVLLSWAVPKGPNLDPAVKRLAMHVEDHPVAYASFEGTIPKGQYGGGTVMVWDRGEWESVGDPREGYRTGRLKFRLHGDKLQGGWMLVRRGSAKSDEEERHWFLFKEKDKWAKTGKKSEIVEKETLSAQSGRSLEDIASDGDSKWQSNRQTPKREMRKSSPKRFAIPAEYDAASQEFHGVRLTSPDKTLYNDGPVTKIDLAAYYVAIADWILPHMVNRPLVLVRCPEGAAGECFYQKHPAPGSPQTLREIPIREKSGTEKYILVDDVAGMISLTQIGALEIHAWGSREDKLEHPDRLIFDLDPDTEIPWSRVIASARQIRKFLQELGLESFVKTTGGKGLHLVLPIDRRHDWDEAKEFCKQVADLITAAAPDQYTTNMSKAARPGKIFIDYLRNGRGSTAILPYSTRAKPTPTVSVPLSWKELTPKLRSDHFTILNVPRRLASLKKDPWQEMHTMHQSLKKAMAEIRRLGKK